MRVLKASDIKIVMKAHKQKERDAHSVLLHRLRNKTKKTFIEYLNAARELYK